DPGDDFLVGERVDVVDVLPLAVGDPGTHLADRLASHVLDHLLLLVVSVGNPAGALCTRRPSWVPGSTRWSSAPVRGPPVRRGTTWRRAGSSTLPVLNRALHVVWRLYL